MTQHFSNKQTARWHLISRGWKQIRNGRWIKDDLIAQILTTETDIVMIQTWVK